MLFGQYSPISYPHAGTTGVPGAVDQGMNRLIEDFLRTRGARYFRGHHDDEYFFLVDFVRHRKGHLNVHLEPGDRDSVHVSVTADRYYPAEQRARLGEIVARWNADTPALSATIHDSCDPRLVGLLASGEYRPADLTDLTGFVDAAVAGAVTLFGAAASVVTPAQQSPHGLRDAG
jgi:hypothetical protein